MGPKAKKILRGALATGAVYLVFTYLLPLVMPFLLAWVTALCLKPSADYVSGKLKITVGKRTLRIPAGVVGALELVVLAALLVLLLCIAGRSIGQQASLFAQRFPRWIDSLDHFLTGICHNMEEVFSLRRGVVVRMAQDMLRDLGRAARQGIMPYLMGNSMFVLGCCIAACVIVVLYVIAVMLFIQEQDDWVQRMRQSAFWPEFARVGRVLKLVGHAYLRTQGIIMLLTTVICTAVFFFLGETYYFLEGIGIGILDALPIFGTGTVLIPWGAILLFQRRWGRAAAILILYVACYVLRQYLEAKMMGDRVGMTALETLASVYVGLQLFGILGVLLGPVGVMLIKEFMKE